MSKRRFGNEAGETRVTLLDHAEQILRDSGYAAVTSRSLAKAAGLSPQIVYYYFKTMDELFTALFQRSAEYYLRSIEAAKTADQPLLEVWQLSCDPSRARFVQEFMALANHRKGLMDQLSQFGRAYHARQTEIVAAEIRDKGITVGMPPAVLAATMEITARGFAFVDGYDMPDHHEAKVFITDLLHALVDKSAMNARSVNGRT